MRCVGAWASRYTMPAPAAHWCCTLAADCRWLRAAELTCDRAALLVAQDSRVMVSALMKLAGRGSAR
jgi:Zn-dependent protease with chaperone function